jgi:hypothetical protein
MQVTFEVTGVGAFVHNHTASAVEVVIMLVIVMWLIFLVFFII